MGGRVRLVLVGGGHAHLEILRRLIAHPRPEIELSLISLDPKHHYSGMVPGYLWGAYSEEQLSFDLPRIVQRAGGRFVRQKAVGLDPAARIVRVDAGAPVPYDLASFNVGSTAAGSGAAEVAAHVHVIKPIVRAVQLRRAIEQLAARGGRAHAVVVGGGAAGVEVACAIATVLERSGGARAVSIIEATDQILTEYSRRFRRLAGRVLEQRGIVVHTGAAVVRVDADAVELATRARIPSHLTVWLAGAAAPDLFHDAGLALDARGFLLVDDALRAVTDAHVFAAGDCATLARYPDTPKAGVYAVREAPVLWRSLLAAVEPAPLARYVPQRGFLSLLNTADGKALLQYKRVVSHSRWAWWLKDWIDRRFVARYHTIAS